MATVLAGCSGSDAAEGPQADGQNEDNPADGVDNDHDSGGDTSPPLTTAPAGPGAEGLDDPYFPTLGNGGYDAVTYDVSLRWDPDTGEIDATSTMTALALQSLTRFNLDYRGPEIEAVVVNGDAADFALDTSDAELVVTPADFVEVGDEFEVRVDYRGVPEAIDGPFGEELGWQTINDTVTVVSEPDGASTWFPVNDHPRDKALYTFAIEVPRGYSVAANGLLTDVVISSDGATETWRWATERPMASYLATVNIGLFKTHEGVSESGVPIRSYFPRDISDRGRDEIEYIPTLVDELEEIFGAYPLEAYGAVVIPEALGFALETQTMSVFGTDTVGSRSVMVHELAHQWFGNSVSPAEWDDVWLNEGFASYAEALWAERNEPGFDIDNQQEANAEFARESLGPPADPGADTLFDPSVYIRGALVLHALRRTVGDDDFFEIVTAWSTDFALANASTDEFIELSETVSGEDLDDFFDDWLFSEEIPALPR